MANTPSIARRIRLELRGIVQGVGFRPYLHNLAVELKLGGFVLNTSSGLVAEAEGDSDAVTTFARLAVSQAPPLAWIQGSSSSELVPTGEVAFSIRPSAARAGEFALISPDVATCAECSADIADPANRRFGYAFTNCTNCGPRYTIVRDIPYDRPDTTMAAFEMCPKCRAEYEDPRNRRFHAQPNACPKCGPFLSAEVGEARRRLAAGEIVAIKGLGGFHLACDARNAEAVTRLRARKRRSDKPFALMARDLGAVEEVCAMSGPDRASLTSQRSPIVIMPRRRPPGFALPEAIAPGSATLGVMLPYTPLHQLLFAQAPYSLLVMTSGNLSEEPIVISNAEATERLAGVADWFLLHNRDIYMRVDDSVVRTHDGVERVLRRSRGYAPQTVDLGRAMPELLACGGELKNAFCLTKGRHAILSQHIGDLENYETLVFFEETLANLKKLFRVEPRAIVHDLHPGYLSTQYALRQTAMRPIGIQHHHAHVAACMAENHLEGEVIGVAFDGTGYGTDGTIWGGEFLVGGLSGFTRRARLRRIPLAGGDSAVREPWRPALAYLMDALGPGASLPGVPEERVRVVKRMIANHVNTASTSSCGRLFDAVAAIIGLRREVTFEAQAAIELEHCAEDGISGQYPFDLNAGEEWEVDFRSTIRSISGDSATKSAATISAMFHNTVAQSIIETCLVLRNETQFRRVCLSGGTFQNMRLLSATTAGLTAAGFEVYSHAQIPPNDGGIALGQAALAAAILQEE
jgi:hydrogenase maturation protein HypF